MRVCESCRKPDAPAVDHEISCKNCPPTADERASSHADDCPKLIHEVRKLYKPAKLISTPGHPEGELEQKWRREGWKVIRDGREVFRWKMLCRGCIEKEAERDMVRRDYVKACKKARGQDDRTYGQLMMQQAQ